MLGAESRLMQPHEISNMLLLCTLIQPPVPVLSFPKLGRTRGTKGECRLSSLRNRRECGRLSFSGLLHRFCVMMGKEVQIDEAATPLFPAMASVLYKYKYTPTYSEDKLIRLTLERKGRQSGLSAPQIYDAAGHHYWNPQREVQYWRWCNFLMHGPSDARKTPLRNTATKEYALNSALNQKCICGRSNMRSLLFQNGPASKCLFEKLRSLAWKRLWARAYRQDLSTQWHSIHSWCSHTTISNVGSTRNIVVHK